MKVKIKDLKPNVEFCSSEDDKLTVKKIRGLICNPIYTGMGPFKPQMVSDMDWIICAKRMVEEEGLEQFLMNMLFVLRESLECLSFLLKEHESKIKDMMSSPLKPWLPDSEKDS